MTELEQYIQSYFGVVQAADLKRIGSFFKPSIIKKGDFFLRANRPCNHFSFIQSGLLRLFTEIDGKEITQWISTQGYFVTDLSGFIFGTPAKWSIQAVSDTHLYTINKTDYNNLVNIVPQWHELEKLFMAKCFTMLEDRVFSHLSMTSEERYQLFFDNNPELFNQVPLQYIASMLGMTPETFSRIRGK